MDDGGACRMKMKTKIWVVISFLVSLTVICVLLGFKYQVPDMEKQEGLTGQFDISAKGDIAYVSYKKGKPTLWVKSSTAQQVTQLSAKESILDLVMMPDGKTVLYVSSDKKLSKKSKSTIHQIDLKSGTDVVILKKDAIVTELVIDPKDEHRLFYLQADEYSNYSPGAILYPFNFDIHSFQLESKEDVRITEMNKYSMTSLQVSTEEDAIYIQMDDDLDVQTAEDTFETKGRVFKIHLAKPDHKMVISIPDETQDLYDFVLIPDRSELVYQAVAGSGADGILEYELFSYNWNTQHIQQLTELHAYAEYPMYGGDGKIYFVVDGEFGGMRPDNTVYRMNPDGSNVEEIVLKE